jgi:APA family basic amino acid/polyamine antiporter
VTQPISAVDRVARGVVSMFGAGLFLGLWPAAALAGWWLVAGMVLAAALAVFFTLSTPDEHHAGQVAPVVGILGRIAVAAAIASTFGAYVLPGRAVGSTGGGAVVLVILVASVVLLAPPLPGMVDRVAAVVVVVVLVIVAVACFTIAPVEMAVAPPIDAAGGDQPLGLLPSAVLLYLCFTGSPATTGTSVAARRERLVALGVVVVPSIAVAIGALWQLGGERLALSSAPLRDALTAADAAGIDDLLSVGVTVACAFALRGVLGDIRDLAPAGRSTAVVVLAAGVAALGALLLDPVYTLTGAAVLLLGEAGIRVLSGRRRTA